MTSSVMEPSDRGRRVPDGPVVLMLNCKSYARYLTSQNEGLQILVGRPLRRVSVSFDQNYIYQQRVLRDEQRFVKLLMQDYRHFSPDRLRETLQTPGWLRREARQKLLDKFTDSVGYPLSDALLAAVELVYINLDDLQEGSNLHDFLPDLFPRAAFFKVRVIADGEKAPQGESMKAERVWQQHPCPVCKREMRGTSGVTLFCENCDTAHIIEL